MELSDEQVRLRDLIKETIPLLCKNGLTYKGGVRIEALIGITIDEEQVFLVNLNERILTAATEKRQRMLDISQEGGDPVSIGSADLSQKAREGNRQTAVKRKAIETNNYGYVTKKRRSTWNNHTALLKGNRHDAEDTYQDSHYATGKETSSFISDEDVIVIEPNYVKHENLNMARNPHQPAIDIVVTPRNSYCCMVCQNVFKDEPALVAHHTNKHSTINFVHPHIARIPFNLPLQDSSSQQNNPPLPRIMWSCTSCSKSYTTQTALNKHLVEKHPDKAPFRCEACDMPFPSENHLKKHIASDCDKLELKSYLDN